MRLRLAELTGSAILSVHPQRGQIKSEDRLLFDSAIGVLFSDRNDLSHDLHVEAVGLGLAVNILDVTRERFFLFFKALDPLDDREQMTGVDFARTDRVRIRCFRHIHSLTSTRFVGGNGSPRMSLQVKLPKRVFPDDESSSARDCQNRQGGGAAGGGGGGPTPGAAAAATA